MPAIVQQQTMLRSESFVTELTEVDLWARVGHWLHDYLLLLLIGRLLDRLLHLGTLYFVDLNFLLLLLLLLLLRLMLLLDHVRWALLV
jgi:hypothetical protein